MGGFGARWWLAVRDDAALRIEALTTARALAGLVDDAGQVSVAVRSLADAVGRPDAAGHAVATVQRGLSSLTDCEHVEVLNPDASRSERTSLRLLLRLSEERLDEAS